VLQKRFIGTAEIVVPDCRNRGAGAGRWAANISDA
jgi:hypothetical protein